MAGVKRASFDGTYGHPNDPGDFLDGFLLKIDQVDHVSMSRR